MSRIIDNNSKKRVIILTWCYDFGVANFGQVLQCYALFRYCEIHGYDVRVIRYRILETDEDIVVLPPFQSLDREVYEEQHRTAQKNNRQSDAFRAFIKKYIKRSCMCYTSTEVSEECTSADLIIVGSDQLWNPKWFDPVFCPEIKNNNQILISYATGGISDATSKNENILKVITDRIQKFNAVSVREEICRKIIGKYTDKVVKVVCDPTFLISSEMWDKIAQSRIVDGKYILCLCYGNVQYQKHLLKEIAKLHGIEKICIIKANDYYKKMYIEKNMKLIENIGPSEFISLIKYANVICTDSYHCFTISLIYEKEFYLLERPDISREDASPDRMNEVCKKLGIANRWVSSKKDLINVERIDYSPIAKKMDKFIMEGEKYLVRNAFNKL